MPRHADHWEPQQEVLAVLLVVTLANRTLDHRVERPVDAVLAALDVEPLAGRPGDERARDLQPLLSLDGR